jgi:hypothetical protein
VFLHRTKSLHNPGSFILIQANPMPGGITGYPVPGGYKYRNLALQVEGVSK